jgi:hypothetical protein
MLVQLNLTLTVITLALIRTRKKIARLSCQAFGKKDIRLWSHEKITDQ